MNRKGWEVDGEGCRVCDAWPCSKNKLYRICNSLLNARHKGLLLKVDADFKGLREGLN